MRGVMSCREVVGGFETFCFGDRGFEVEYFLTLF